MSMSLVHGSIALTLTKQRHTPLFRKAKRITHWIVAWLVHAWYDSFTDLTHLHVTHEYTYRRTPHTLFSKKHVVCINTNLSGGVNDSSQHKHTFTYICTHIHIRVHLRMHIYKCICISICTYIYICMCIYTYILIDLGICLCIYMCMCMHKYVRVHNQPDICCLPPCKGSSSQKHIHM